MVCYNYISILSLLKIVKFELNTYFYCQMRWFLLLNDHRLYLVLCEYIGYKEKERKIII